MRVLVVGGGGREHALAWRLRQSPQVDAVFCAPGNAGIADVAECVPIAADDLAGLERFARERAIDWDDQKQILDIPDPYLLFYLRWSGRLMEPER